jgi:glc operon protein GlcG
MMQFAVQLAGAASLCAATALAHAQAYGNPITLDQAKKVMAAAEVEARKNSWSMTIVILDSGCNPVMMQKADGSQIAAPQVAHDKAYTACAYKRPTKALQDALAKGAADWRYLTFPRMIAADGGLPIVVDGKIVGAIGVSGATGPDDARVGQAGIDALKQ